jgi:pimeloyl-ACP methyl ester carboxylesterase
MRQLPVFFSLLTLGAAVTTGAAQPFTPPPPSPLPGKAPAATQKPAPAPPAAAAAKPVPANCPPHPWDGRTIVIVANGAGGGEGVSENLREVAGEAQSGLVIRTEDWSRYGSVPEDNCDTEGHFLAATRIAGCVQNLRSSCPQSRFVLVGYSAGTRVVLAAAEMLPPASLDRVVLMASSCSCRYDLRLALKASCGGIDSFYSADDTILATVEQGIGTTDGYKDVPTGGRVGFRLPCDAKDCAEYAGLRQYAWCPEIGGQGEHTFWGRPLFLRTTLVPLIMTAGCPVAAGPTRGEPPLLEKKR